MSRKKLATLTTVLTGLGFFATAGIHLTGLDSIRALAAQGPSDLEALAPALWISFSLDLVVLGLILLVVAIRPIGPARLVVAICGLAPLGAACLQLCYLGFIPPTAILLTIAVLAFGSAALIGDTPHSAPP